MTVKDLIKELKKMPKDLNVFYSHHDNCEFEIAGSVNSVDHMVKEDLREMASNILEFKRDIDMFESNPEEWIILKD